MERSRDRQLVQSFLDLYNRARGKSFCVSSWPEDTNRNAPAVDAIAIDGPVTMAIEHTVVQPFVNAWYESDIFNQVVNSLEDDPRLCQQGWDSALSMPVGAVPKGENRTDAGRELRRWLEANLESCPEGRSQHRISNLPFDFIVTITRCYVPDIPGYFHVSRDIASERLAELQLNIQVALRTKLPKLVRADANIKVLLLERSDTLFDDSHFGEEVRKGLANTKPNFHPSAVWLVNTVYLKTGETLAFIELWPEYQKHRFIRNSSAS